MRTFSNWTLACTLALAVGSAVPAAAQGEPRPGTSGQSGSGQTGGGTAGGAGQMGGQEGAQEGVQVGRDNQQSDLQKFVEKAAISNMAEIQLGQLAQEKAQSPEVKQFAQTMVDEHQKAHEQLKQAATSAGITVPSSLDEKHQKLHDKLSNLSGSEFDREYMKAMVKAHDDTRKLLEKRVGKSNASDRSGASDIGGSAGASGAAGTSGAEGTSSTGTSGTSGTGTSGSAGSTAGSAGSTAGSAGSGTETSTSGGVSASAAASAGDIDSWAAATLPNVQNHLQMAKDLEKRVKDEAKNNRNEQSDRNDQ